MDKYAIGEVVDLISFMSSMGSLWAHVTGPNAPHNQRHSLLPEQHEDISARAARLHDLLVQLDVPVSAKYANDLKRALAAGFVENGNYIFAAQNRNNVIAALRGISNTTGTELSTKLFFSVAAKQSTLYEPPAPHFGAEVRTKFRSATFDIDEAAKCLAFGRATAAVFHLMRVLEHGIKAVILCLGLTIPDNPSWGILLSEIRKERLRRGDSKWEENDLFQDLWQHLDSIKDAQRDGTMHVETIHTEEDATLIFDNTRAFMKKVAARMDENGEPKA